MKQTAVLIHGLWMSGAEMFLLRKRLRRCGYRVFQFRYRTVSRDIAENARQLQQFLSNVPGDEVHFVAHSLGGLVVRQLFHEFPDQRPGRIVTMGTPHNGSGMARHLARSNRWRRILGASYSPLSGHVPAWHGERELGSIAGTLSFGLAWLLKNLPEPNDGTVATSEAHLADMSDYVEIHTSHSGLLFSGKAAQQVCTFLKTGHFSRLSKDNQKGKPSNM